MNEFGFVFREAGTEVDLSRVFLEESDVEDTRCEVGSFFGRVAAVLCVKSLTEFGVFFSKCAPGVSDGCKSGFAGFGGGSVALAESILHGVVGGEGPGILFVAVPSPPGLVEDGLGAGGVDDFVEAECGLFEAIGEKSGSLALVLKDDEVVFSVFDFLDGFLFGEVKGEGLAAWIDEGELGLGVGGGLDEVDDGVTNAAGVAVADEEDLFGCFWSRCFWSRLAESKRSEEGDDRKGEGD